MECHWSYAPPPTYVRTVGGPRYRFPKGMRYRAEMAARVGPWEAVARADPHDLEVLSTYYDGELAHADHHLEELLDTLERTGHLRDDGRGILLVTSDHGEHLGEHGLADHHASLDELMTTVPFVSWGPGIVPAGAVREPLAEFVDVLPSLAALLDVDRRPSTCRVAAPTCSAPAATSIATRSRSGGRGPITNASGSRRATRRSRGSTRSRATWSRARRPDEARARVRRQRAGCSTCGTTRGEDRDLARHRARTGRLGAQLDARTGRVGLVEGETGRVTPEERAEIERRLEDLGYI